MKYMHVLLPVLYRCMEAIAQLLSWSPQFSKHHSPITTTADTSKGKRGWMGYTEAIYMHPVVITNVNSGTTDSKYVPATWEITNAPVDTPLGDDKWSSTMRPCSIFVVLAGTIFPFPST